MDVEFRYGYLDGCGIRVLVSNLDLECLRNRGGVGAEVEVGSSGRERGGIDPVLVLVRTFPVFWKLLDCGKPECPIDFVGVCVSD